MVMRLLTRIDDFRHLVGIRKNPVRITMKLIKVRINSGLFCVLSMMKHIVILFD